METNIYNTQGKKAGTIQLPENLFNVAWSDALMHQVVTVMQANARTPVAHVKERGDVRGGGKKPWRQKGTGRARHGSSRSPIWKGGGVTHGPRNEKTYARELPKKMRAKALFMALSRKLKDGELIFVDSFATDVPKTAVAKKALVSIGDTLKLGKLTSKPKNAALIALSDPREATVKSFRNIGNVEVRSVRDLNPVLVLRYTYLVIENPEAAVAILAHRVKGKAKVATGEKEKKTRTPRKISEKAVKDSEKKDQ